MKNLTILFLFISTSSAFGQLASPLTGHIPHIPDSTMAVISVQPSRLASHPAFQSLPKSLIEGLDRSGVIRQLTGIDLKSPYRDIPRLTSVVFSFNERGRSESWVTLASYQNADVATAAFIDKAGGAVTPKKWKKWTIYTAVRRKSNVQRSRSFVEIGKNVVAIGSEQMLHEFLDAPATGKAAIHQIVRDLPPNETLSFGVNLSATDDNERKFVMNLNRLITENRLTLDVHDLRSLKASMDLRNPTFASIDADCRTTNAAAAAEADMKQLLTLGQAGLYRLIDTAAGEKLRPLVVHGQKLLTGATFNRKESTTQLIIPNPGDWAELITQLNSTFRWLDAERKIAERQSQLRNIGIGLYQYAERDPRGRLGKYSVDFEGKRILSWRVNLAATEAVKTPTDFGALDLKKSWDAPVNKPFAAAAGSFAIGAEDPGRTRFLMVIPLHKAEQAQPFYTLRELDRSPTAASELLLVVEVGTNKAIPWTQPVDLQVDPKDPFAALGNLKDNTFIGLMADGSVRKFRTDELTPEQFLDMCRIPVPKKRAF